jgi:hypothetical protein
VAYRPDEIGAAEKKIVIDQSLINDFQKMVNRFNSGIIVKSDAPPTDEDYLNPPPTEMIEDKYKFTKPVGNYHSNLVPDMQVFPK